MGKETIKVVVRARPPLPRESGEAMVAQMSDQTVTIPGDGGAKHNFNFDEIFDSTDPGSSTFSGQEDVYAKIGAPTLQAGLDGYNACLFAYGQTGSGKSFSVMGYGQDPGIIPRLTEELFVEKEKVEKSGHKLKIFVSYVELYNNQIRDLLDAKDGEKKEELRVVEHPKLGIYVPNLTESPVMELPDIQRLMDFGTKRRVTAATNMNSTSSRSHAVFTLKLKRLESEKSGTSAQVHIVDLAGSERVSESKTEGTRLKEGCSINFALTVLGQVIRELTDPHKKGATFASYRSAKLTFMLKDAIGGNAKTTMLAAISPCANAAPETVSTLRFATSVKKVLLKPQVNAHTSSDEMVKHLKEELQKLKAQYEAGGGDPDLHDEIKERHRLLADFNKSEQQQIEESEKLMRERDEVMKNSGLSTVEIEDMFGVEHEVPYLLNISDDPLLTGSLLYFIKPDVKTTVGSDASCTITLKGLGMPPHLCTLTNTNNDTIILERATEEGRVICNGVVVQGQRQMKHNDWIMLGRASALRIGIPAHESAEIEADYPRDLPEMLQNLVPEESDAYAELRYYVEEMVNKMDQARVHGFFETLREACPLVDEANEITRSIPAYQNLKFEVEFVWDIYNCTPEEIILIRVLRFEDAALSRVLYYWSYPVFKRRLALMRDAHTEFDASGGKSWHGQNDPLQDPWKEVSIVELKQRMQQIKNDERKSAGEKFATLAERDGSSVDPSMYAASGLLVTTVALKKFKKAASAVRASIAMSRAFGGFRQQADGVAGDSSPKKAFNASRFVPRNVEEKRAFDSMAEMSAELRPAAESESEIRALKRETAAAEAEANSLRAEMEALKKDLQQKTQTEESMVKERTSPLSQPAPLGNRYTVAQTPTAPAPARTVAPAPPRRVESVKQLVPGQPASASVPVPGTSGNEGPTPRRVGNVVMKAMPAVGSFVAPAPQPGAFVQTPIVARGTAERASTPPRRVAAAAVRAQSPATIRYQSPPRDAEVIALGGSVIRGVSATSRGFGQYAPANDPHARLVAVTDGGWVDATGQVHAFSRSNASTQPQGTAALRQRSEPARR